jgi:deazaflavin-dependent oxidoreductase (nitroreductase family)
MSDSTDRTNPNQPIIDEFRANAGKVGGYFEGKPLLLLHYKGRTSGRELVTPLMYNTDGDRLVIFATQGGAPTHPQWYGNLKANPEVEVEVGTDRWSGRVVEVEGSHRDELWVKQKAEWPQFAVYEQKTDRVFPVLAIERT